MWPIYQDLLLNGLVVWASLKLCPGALVIKYRALQTGAGETTLSLFNQDRSLRYRARRCGILPCSLPPLHTHVSSHLGKHSHINLLTAHTCVLTPKSMCFYSTPLFMRNAHSPALSTHSNTPRHTLTLQSHSFIHSEVHIILRFYTPHNTQVVVQFTCGHTDIFQHTWSSMHCTHLDTHTLEVLHLEAKGSSVPIPAFTSLQIYVFT